MRDNNLNVFWIFQVTSSLSYVKLVPCCVTLLIHSRKTFTSILFIFKYRYRIQRYKATTFTTVQVFGSGIPQENIDNSGLTERFAKNLGKSAALSILAHLSRTKWNLIVKLRRGIWMYGLFECWGPPTPSGGKSNSECLLPLKRTLLWPTQCNSGKSLPTKICETVFPLCFLIFVDFATFGFSWNHYVLHFSRLPSPLLPGVPHFLQDFYKQ